MEKKVHVSVRGKQKNEFDSDEISFECPGRLIEKNGTFYLSYDEISDDGSASAKITLKMTSSRAAMIRSGGSSATMVFIPGGDTYCDYDTGAGILKLEIHTDKLAFSSNEDVCSCSIKYKLRSNGMLLSNNEITVKAKTVPAE